MSDILDKIVATKKIEVANCLQKMSLANQRDIHNYGNQDGYIQNRRIIVVIAYEPADSHDNHQENGH